MNVHVALPLGPQTAAGAVGPRGGHDLLSSGLL